MPPVVFIAIYLLRLEVSEWVRNISVYLWPTQLQMMAASGYPTTHQWFWSTFAISAACNVLLYVTVGFFFCWIFVDLLWFEAMKRRRAR